MELLQGTQQMIQIIVSACVLVLGAMGIDLAAGLYKAKQRGEVHSSWGLKRTISKFISYEGSMLIGAGVDILVHFCKMWQVVGLDSLEGVPVITCLIGIFLLIVEFISLRESADEKTKNRMSQAEEVINKVVDKDELAKLLSAAIKTALLSKDKNNEED